MKLRILGCSGGIGGEHLRTTSLLVDDDVLIDAGTGVGDLPIDELARIDHLFLTHTHLDHIACLPLMIDSVADRRGKPLTVYGIPPVLDILRKHVFNWLVWPDFTEIPSTGKPFMR
ncbi:MAG: MBL fold metallo-hydrolase, partial [Azonexus sp.]